MSVTPPESPGDEVPESDWAEQHTIADPWVEAEESAAGIPGQLGRGTLEANEADLVEQETVAYVDDEV
jgi:hypothetical protein